jgi:hypothetical protein
MAPDTGQVTEASIDEDVTTAPARLRDCVVKAIAGLGGLVREGEKGRCPTAGLPLVQGSAELRRRCHQSRAPVVSTMPITAGGTMAQPDLPP